MFYIKRSEIVFHQYILKNSLVIKAVQTLPIILDTSKTIRLIFCALYKLSEPERQAEAEAIRQRRLGRKIFINIFSINKYFF